MVLMKYKSRTYNKRDLFDLMKFFDEEVLKDPNRSYYLVDIKQKSFGSVTFYKITEDEREKIEKEDQRRVIG